jgi:hypothetical protein
MLRSVLVPHVLHGRDVPLGVLRAALEGAIGGRGQLAVVSGEAGIGKSALAASLAHEAEARGATVTWGRAWEFADAPPYFPVWPCLRALGITIGDGRRSEAEAYRLWEDVVTELARASSAKPAVWILEDLHAADLGTLDLLTFLAQPLRAMGVPPDSSSSPEATRSSSSNARAPSRRPAASGARCPCSLPRCGRWCSNASRCSPNPRALRSRGARCSGVSSRPRP